MRTEETFGVGVRHTFGFDIVPLHWGLIKNTKILDGNFAGFIVLFASQILQSADEQF